MQSKNKGDSRGKYNFDLEMLEEVGDKNNKVLIVGELRGKFEYSYFSRLLYEPIYKATITVARKSSKKDNIKILVPGRVVSRSKETLTRGKTIRVIGTLYSRIHNDGQKNRLMMSVMAQGIELYEGEEIPEFNNCIYLEGTVHKPPYMRRNEYTNRTITDLFISSVRKSEESRWNMIPCVAWGKLAHEVGKLKVGDTIVLKGRLQSRNYLEKYDAHYETPIMREVNEVSIFEVIKKEENQ